MVVSSIFYFHPYLGKIPILTNVFQTGWNHQLDLLSWPHPAECDQESHLQTSNMFHCGIPLAAFLKPAIWCCTTIWRLQKGRCIVAKRRTPPPKERYWKDIFTPYILSTPLSFYSMYNVDLINSSCDLSFSLKVKISCVNPRGMEWWRRGWSLIFKRPGIFNLWSFHPFPLLHPGRESPDFLSIRTIIFHFFLGGETSNIFMFIPKIGEDDPIWIHIFQRGWFNHQLVSGGLTSSMWCLRNWYAWLEFHPFSDIERPSIFQPMWSIARRDLHQHHPDLTEQDVYRWCYSRLYKYVF